MKPLRIGVDIRGLLTGKISGVEQYAIQILRHILAIDHTNTYVLFYVAYKDRDVQFENLVQRYPFLKANNIEVKTLKWPDAPLLLHATFKPLNWPKADLICGGLDVMFMPSPQLLPLSRRCAKVTTFHDLIFMIHPEFFTLSSRIWQWQMSYGYEARTSDIVISVSENTKKDILRFTPAKAENIEVVMEGVGQEYFENHSHLFPQLKERFSLPDKYVYFVGSLEPRKNLSTLIRAISHLNNTQSDTIKLVISGQKSWLFEDVYQLIEELGMQENIIFTGPVTESEKITLLQAAQVFVFPSVYEGFGLMILEAFATQTPVVISNNSSLPEVAGDGALVVPTFDHLAMAEAVQQIISDPILKNRLITHGLARARELSWEQAAQKTLDILKRAVDIHVR